MSGRVFDRMFYWPLRFAITFYRGGISPYIPGTCRFHPSCSTYAEQAIKTHGAARGLFLTLRRIGRCHPWGGHGYDPVPECGCGHEDGAPERSRTHA